MSLQNSAKTSKNLEKFSSRWISLNIISQTYSKIVSLVKVFAIFKEKKKMDFFV